jgi:3' terminal RNA ribose 2'-O-methyltransferase Hen1
MLLTLSTTHQPATDLGYLLHKHPDRAQTFEVPFGRAHVFYPEAGEARCTAALVLDVDPVSLVRGRRPGGESGPLGQYVNDRPYVASSFLSVALAEVFRTALNGGCALRPELVDLPLPLEIRLPALPCRGGAALLRGLFEPLGYEVHAAALPLDETWPEWGEAPYLDVTLRATLPLKDALAHLYVLIPVLDAEKHYWIGDDEVDKLLRRGEGWLAGHPARDMIARRYLRRRQSLVREALRRLAVEVAAEDEDEATRRVPPEEAVERRLSLHDQRLAAVLGELKAAGAHRVLDLGCGEGRLLRELLADPQFTEIVGVDVSFRALETARDRLRLERLPAAKRARLRLLHGALTYRDERLAGFDAAAVVEVIEHLDAARLTAFERVVFEHARPAALVVTTPNAEYNVRWESLPAGKFRHPDHRFEWTRAEFAGWGTRTAERFGYQVRFMPVGPDDPEVGPPSQLAAFRRVD